MIFIDYSGAALALFLLPPNWANDIKLELQFPTAEITKARSHVETREGYGQSSRYTFEYIVDTRDAGESTKLRMWLNRLGTEMVAVPLWTDAVELTAQNNAGATALAKTSDNPVQSGAEWIVLSPDTSIYEIVVVNSFTSGAITLASGLTLNWPPGTRMFPLFFGRLSEMPDFAAETDEVLNGTIRFQEDSPYARRLNTFDPGLTQTVGGGVPGFVTTPLFNIRPNHTKIMDHVEVDILYKLIGFGREEMSYEGPYPKPRGLELEFLQDSRAAIAQLTAFFVSRMATLRTFFLPTFRGDLRLTDDRNIGETILRIEPSRYTDEDYLVNPGVKFLALVDRQHILPVQIDTIDEDGLHMATAIGTAFKKDETKLCNLQLSRFAEPKLSLVYHTDWLVSCKIKFIEVPTEYTLPHIEVVSQRAYVFQFSERVDVDYVLGNFTNYEQAIISDGTTFVPAPFDFKADKSGLTLDDTLELISWDYEEINGVLARNPLRMILDGTLEGKLRCYVVDVNALAPADGSARLVCGGFVRDLDATGKEWKAIIDPWEGFLDRDVPHFYRQKVCNVPLFSTKCAFGRPTMKEDFKSLGTLFVVTGANSIEVSPVAGQPDPREKPPDYFANGWVEAGTGATFERRTINSSVVIPGGARLALILNRGLLRTSVGAQMRFWPQCNGSSITCRTIFDNLGNMRGHPCAPNDNPSAEIPEVQQEAGGKKG